MNNRNTKHTPGPWRSHGELINSDKREIGEVYDFKSNGETGANARLIAAAPELLEALLRVDAYLHKIAGDKTVHDLVYEAIAKATSGVE